MSTLQVRLQDLITAIGTDYKQLRTWITGSASGDLTGLTTTDKTSLVNAINEVKAGAGGSVPDSTTSVKGIVELATNAETLTGTDAVRAVTPAGLASLGNVANGYLKLDGTGKAAAAQLPSYVDDVLEYANLAAFPGTGTTGVIFVALDTNKTYRWSGSAYVEISASPGTTDALTEGSTNLYFTNARWDARMTTMLGDPNTDLAALYTTAKA
jgi:hypothetical protein